MAKATTKKAKNAKTSTKAPKGPRKFVYFFGNGKADGNRTMKDTLGGKGAGLAEMTNAGLPVPAGFTISTDACNIYYANKSKLPQNIETEMVAQLRKLEKAAGAELGSKKNPLLVSVRSGARESMPGMMDTILNLGLNDETVEGLKAKTGNGRFAYDSYRRFVQMYGDVVMGVQKRHENEAEPFDHIIDGLKEERGVHEDTDLSEADLKVLIARFRALIKERTGKAFPSDPIKQLEGAIGAVFGSWMNDRAII